jgi:hypothetical protein
MEKRTSSSTPQEDVADDTSNSGRKEPRRNISRACEPCRQRKVKVSVNLRGFPPVIRTRMVLWLTVILQQCDGQRSALSISFSFFQNIFCFHRQYSTKIRSFGLRIAHQPAAVFSVLSLTLAQTHMWTLHRLQVRLFLWRDKKGIDRKVSPPPLHLIMLLHRWQSTSLKRTSLIPTQEAEGS